MASSSQRRCVFVGNIPYDASEEQLIDVCSEVGPVVSFRLVTDRESGKPKGYGFCEYKDEETALSARRNLHGYEINGRQLRVDFAENDKNAERAREQARAGTELIKNVVSSHMANAEAMVGTSNDKPIGLHAAEAAASIMAGTLHGMEVGWQPNGTRLQNVQGHSSDALTLHLARFSKNQLSEVINELREMTMNNKDMARQLLLSKPQLLKALFQAQIMLGMVTKQMMSDIEQSSLHPALPLQGVLQSNQTATRIPLPNPFSVPTQSPPQPQFPLLPIMNEARVSQQSLVPPPSRVPLPQLGTTFQPLPQEANLPPSYGSLPLPLQVKDRGIHMAHDSHKSLHATNEMAPALFSSAHDTDYQLNLRISPGNSDLVVNGASDSARVNGRTRTKRPHEFAPTPPKLAKLNDGKIPTGISGDIPFHKTGVQLTEMPISQPPLSLPPDAEADLLRQVIDLTPEHLSSLPPVQREQVILLQRALRKDQAHLT